MTTTLADLISETEQNLLAGDREEMNQLASDVTDTATTFTFARTLGGIQQGSYISIDLEVMYVWDVSDTPKTATVQRGMLGSTAVAHTADSLVYVNPRFSKYRMMKAINQELRDVSTPPNGLFQVKSFTLTTQPVSQFNPIPSANTDILDILEARWLTPTANQRRVRVWNKELRILRNLPTVGTASSPSGMAIQIESQGYWYPGRPLEVWYAAPFTELAALTDDAATVTGMPASALDIPPLGAAMRLMGVREAKRTFVESAVDSRRAGEVPVGSASKAAATLMSILQERIASELTRLRRQWPQYQ